MEVCADGKRRVSSVGSAPGVSVDSWLVIILAGIYDILQLDLIVYRVDLKLARVTLLWQVGVETVPGIGPALMLIDSDNFEGVVIRAVLGGSVYGCRIYRLMQGCCE
jgi:hypothetical protein